MWLELKVLWRGPGEIHFRWGLGISPQTSWWNGTFLSQQKFKPCRESWMILIWWRYCSVNAGFAVTFEVEVCDWLAAIYYFYLKSQSFSWCNILKCLSRWPANRFYHPANSVEWVLKAIALKLESLSSCLTIGEMTTHPFPEKADAEFHRLLQTLRKLPKFPSNPAFLSRDHMVPPAWNWEKPQC